MTYSSFECWWLTRAAPSPRALRGYWAKRSFSCLFALFERIFQDDKDISGWISRHKNISNRSFEAGLNANFTNLTNFTNWYFSVIRYIRKIRIEPFTERSEAFWNFCAFWEELHSGWGYVFSKSCTYRCQKVFQHQWAASQHKSSKLDILHSTCTIGRLTPVVLNANLAN